jgi:hypothetical protein
LYSMMVLSHPVHHLRGQREAREPLRSSQVCEYVYF